MRAWDPPARTAQGSGLIKYRKTWSLPLQSSALNSCWHSPGLLTSSYRSALKPAEAVGAPPLISKGSGSLFPLSHISRLISEHLHPSSSDNQSIIVFIHALKRKTFTEIIYSISWFKKQTTPFSTTGKGSEDICVLISYRYHHFHNNNNFLSVKPLSLETCWFWQYRNQSGSTAEQICVKNKKSTGCFKYQQGTLKFSINFFSWPCDIFN